MESEAYSVRGSIDCFMNCCTAIVHDDSAWSGNEAVIVHNKQCSPWRWSSMLKVLKAEQEAVNSGQETVGDDRKARGSKPSLSLPEWYICEAQNNWSTCWTCAATSRPHSTETLDAARRATLYPFSVLSSRLWLFRSLDSGMRGARAGDWAAKELINLTISGLRRSECNKTVKYCLNFLNC